MNHPDSTTTTTTTATAQTDGPDDLSTLDDLARQVQAQHAADTATRVVRALAAQPAPSLIGVPAGHPVEVEVLIDLGEGRQGWLRQPVIGYDTADGMPWVVAVPATWGRAVRADAYGSKWRTVTATPQNADPEEVVSVVPGSSAPIELADGTLATVSAWGVTRSGQVKPLATTARPETTRRVERDAEGNITGTVEQ